MSKTLYTSYYAKSASHPLAYAISSKVPTHFLNLKRFPILSPRWSDVLSCIKGEISDQELAARYMDLIVDERRLNAHQIVDVLPDGAVLLCYETSDEAVTGCHRRQLARWLESETGIVVPELDYVPAIDVTSLIEW